MASTGSGMADGPSIHAFILCWPGKEAGAHHIAYSLEKHVDHLTVLYKNDTDRMESGPGEWIKIPNAWFYGKQFKKSLDLNRGEIMMHIQADAKFDNWPLIISKCKDSFRSFHDVGVWAPNVYHSVWTPDITSICPLRGSEIFAVTMTDGIVWALSSPVIDRLRMFDYDVNNFGWGICEAACAFAFTHNMLVLMDLSVKVEHPEGSGYCNVEALAQGKKFVDQLSAAERIQFNWVQITKTTRESTLRQKPSRSWKKLWKGLRQVFDKIQGRPKVLQH